LRLGLDVVFSKTKVPETREESQGVGGGEVPNRSVMRSIKLPCYRKKEKIKKTPNEMKKNTKSHVPAFIRRWPIVSTCQ